MTLPHMQSKISEWERFVFNNNVWLVAYWRQGINNLVTVIQEDATALFGVNKFPDSGMPPLLTLSRGGGWYNFAPPAAFSILHIENIFREPQ